MNENKSAINNLTSCFNRSKKAALLQISRDNFGDAHTSAYLFSFLAEDVGAGLIVYCCKARVTDRMLHSFQSSVK